jgi:hypothetical protein
METSSEDGPPYLDDLPAPLPGRVTASVAAAVVASLSPRSRVRSVACWPQLLASTVGAAWVTLHEPKIRAWPGFSPGDSRTMLNLTSRSWW